MIKVIDLGEKKALVYDLVDLPKDWDSSDLLYTYEKTGILFKDSSENTDNHVVGIKDSDKRYGVNADTRLGDLGRSIASCFTDTSIQGSALKTYTEGNSNTTSIDWGTNTTNQVNTKDFVITGEDTHLYCDTGLTIASGELNSSLKKNSTAKFEPMFCKYKFCSKTTKEINLYKFVTSRMVESFEKLLGGTGYELLVSTDISYNKDNKEWVIDLLMEMTEKEGSDLDIDKK